MMAMIAVIAMGVFGAGLQTTSNPVQPATPGGSRAVDVEISGIPVDLPAQISLGGVLPSGSDGTSIHFDRIDLGPADLQWVVGDGCTVDACPGNDCPVVCGMGVMPVEIIDGEGVQSVTLEVEVPLRKVIINIPSLADKGRIFKKKIPLRMSLDGAVGTISDGNRGIFKSVEPGTHQVIASIGACGVDDMGCWPDKGCPEGCRSKRIEIEVEWKQEDVILTIALPVPD